MLEPDGRLLLLDALRPPIGSRLEAAFGTTYSLDLLSLLTAPVAFALFDRQRADGTFQADPIAMLQALREYSGRITIFHQAGQIAVPPIDQRLIVYLEKAVYPVVPHRPDAIFHPKVWYLRYRDEDSGDIALRFLCLSRNLTSDRSWDTVLRLDGVLGDERKHEPLADFANALVRLAYPLHPVPEDRAQTVRGLGDDFARAEWTLPDGVGGIDFWPLGHDGTERWPFAGRIDRMLVVSPFLTQGTVSALTRKRRGSILLSRPESLDRLGSKALAHLTETLVLSSDASAGADEAAGEASSEIAGPDHRLVGLHAKTYVADAGAVGRIWTGSANATDAAFHGNVEFLVEMTGRNRDCGLQAVIGDRTDRLALRKLVEEYVPPTTDPLPLTEDEKLEARLDEIRRVIGRLRFVVECVPAVDERWSVRLVGRDVLDSSAPWAGLDGVELSIWPATLGSASGIAPNLDCGLTQLTATFRLSDDAVTPFFCLSASIGDLRTAFAVVAELHGGPDDRVGKVLGQMLRDKPSLIRFLLLLLGNLDEALDGFDSDNQGGSFAGGWAAAFESNALLEPLLKAYSRDPERLRDIQNVLAELGRSGGADDLLPEHWAEIWEPISQALSEGAGR
jgi:hypothetical protein